MTFSADAHLSKLKLFQRHTVEHVCRRFFDDVPAARRFLVADETGLGKSMVARGVIAKTIERLQHDDTVKRIDIVYVCSNPDIANQNLDALDVLGHGTRHHATRLTLLARDSGDLDAGTIDPEVGKKVNLISFTPGTSFDLGWSTGRSDERVLLHQILCAQFGLQTLHEQKAAAVVLRGGSGFDTFYGDTQRANLQPDRAIVMRFMRMIRSSGLSRRFLAEVRALGHRIKDVSSDEKRRHDQLVGELRSALAKAGVDALQPDLIILDEFQRFRHLLAVEDNNYADAAELADALFSHGDAKVLLLSATPYKPFTYAEEAALGDDHEADLHRTLGFLAGDPGSPSVKRVVERLSAFRSAAVKGQPVAPIKQGLEEALLQMMCRTERPRLGDDGMLAELVAVVDDVTASDIEGFVALRKLARELENSVLTVDYWKSSPYFVNFSDGYQLGQRLRVALKEPGSRQALRPLIKATQHLDRHTIEALGPVDPGNARLRQLIDDTIEQGWWKLLWMPASMPYQPLGGPFAEPGVQGMTKRLIFSSWMATPSAITMLLSYEARRRIASSAADLESKVRRLQFRRAADRPAAMNVLAMFWPSPDLAMAADPRSPSQPIAAGAPDGDEISFWASLFNRKDVFPIGLDAAAAAAPFSAADSDSEESSDGTALRAHIDLAFATGANGALERSPIVDAEGLTDQVAKFGPGNIAYRCINRLSSGPLDQVSLLARWEAAATLANGIRRLFDRRESILLLGQLLPHHVYWRAVLQYCAWGNLEAVLDEHLHHISAKARNDGMDDADLREVISKVVRALTLAPAPYSAFDPLHPDKPISFSGSRFALRYGSKQADKEESTRRLDVQNAFNSPFWPFVLATTSVGQEGIDFHPWCHATLHWNTPASPVDFEQREGRVHRYGGHAVRRNLAQRHNVELLKLLSNSENSWDTAYDLGALAAADQFGELTPYWIFDGDHKVQRHLFLYPLSQDDARYQRLKDDLAVYRLSFGQPRQEDIVDILRKRGVISNPTLVDELRIDLRPPGGRGKNQFGPSDVVLALERNPDELCE